MSFELVVIIAMALFILITPGLFFGLPLLLKRMREEDEKVQAYKRAERAERLKRDRQRRHPPA